MRYDIRDNGKLAQDFVAGFSFEKFRDDRLFFYAVTRALEIISEAARRLPAELRDRLERFLAATGVEVAGIEFITDAAGRIVVYDVNTNTNYNPDAEARAGYAGTARSGPGAVADFLEREAVYAF